MAISRAQMEEQLEGFENGGTAATIDIQQSDTRRFRFAKNPGFAVR